MMSTLFPHQILSCVVEYKGIMRIQLKRKELLGKKNDDELEPLSQHCNMVRTRSMAGQSSTPWVQEGALTSGTLGDELVRSRVTHRPCACSSSR